MMILTITLNDTINLIINPIGFLLAGAGLGLFFYCGLWWTTRTVIAESRSPLWFVPSFVVRFSLTGTGFYLLSLAGWPAMLTAFVGFNSVALWQFAVI